VEVGLRREIAQLHPSHLAKRCAKLQAAGRKDDPELRRRDRLERAIKLGRENIERFRREREAIEAMSPPPSEELARYVALEASSREGLERNVNELKALPKIEAAGVDSRPLNPHARLEGVLIDERIAALARREVDLARPDSSHVIYRTLGPFPAELDKAAVWADASHAIATYRYRHDINAQDAPLGMREPRGAVARAERIRAQQRIDNALRSLSLDREPSRTLDADLSA
jgi:hypothetical protein